MQFYAQGMGVNGPYIVAESSVFEGNSLPFVDSKKSQEAFVELTRKLVRDGWVSLGCVNGWCEYRFRRVR